MAAQDEPQPAENPNHDKHPRVFGGDLGQVAENQMAENPVGYGSWLLLQKGKLDEDFELAV
ncbi:hypothetical protein [Azospirillum sp. SYSU D00513]|uniref:hypothetical protein n=1 Tax=Azospirillum sp. SYSU D00513 TaxID=2812561 RepID=UPI001A960556|nr:hypothetical protein [Azospirillum sp. SYSU D00513]